LLGTQLLEASLAVGVEIFVNAGTFWQHYNSQDYCPRCLYSATKQAFESILRFYSDARRVKAITLTLFDTYGPNDSRNKLFAQLRQAAKIGVPLKMSPGGQKLDLVFIDDVVEAFVQAERLLSTVSAPAHSVYGVSSGRHILLKDVVAQYRQITGLEVPVDWGARPYREREIMVPWVPTSFLPGWSPRVTLDEGIRRMERESCGLEKTLGTGPRGARECF
jgi:nucleoside-diphosphate-sugar epimerase